MSILNDKAIAALQENDLITPYWGTKQRTVNGHPAISFGLSQCGYDICLSPDVFRVYDNYCNRPQWNVFDPKAFDDIGRQVELTGSDNGDYFTLPARSMGLGVSLELISMPEHVFALFQGKSTYARCGLIANVMPAEPGWAGHMTMCFVNPGCFDIKLYANEGIAQMILFDCGQVGRAYTGHYQNQGAKVTLAAV